MGTSSSSKGPVGGVPLVPPWVPDPVPPQPQDQDTGNMAEGGDGNSATQSDGPTQSPATPQWQSPIAAPGRFGGARLNFGSFSRNGNSRDMRRGLRDYVRKGYGGSGTAVRRFGGTATTGAALYGALSSLAGGQAATPGSPLDKGSLAGRSAREVMDAIIEAVRPADGTQDAEASRAAIKNALSEMLTSFPEADLLNLTQDQCDLAIERFVAIDVYKRTALDIGKTIQDKAPTATVAAARLKEVKEYIKQTVAAAFRKMRGLGQRLTSGRVNQVIRAALGETFRVFEEYLI